MTRWQVRTRSVNEVVEARDQFEAWDTLRDCPASDFGIVVSAEPGENMDPISVHTAALMFSWGRTHDAHLAIRAAIRQGLPDTTEADLKLAEEMVVMRSERR